VRAASHRETRRIAWAFQAFEAGKASQTATFQGGNLSPRGAPPPEGHAPRAWVSAVMLSRSTNSLMRSCREITALQSVCVTC